MNSHRHNLTDAELQRRRAAFEQKLRHHIATTGWAVINTYFTGAEGDNVPVSYTVGLTERDLPELGIVGLNHHTAQSFLNTLGARATKGGELRHGTRITDLANADMILVEGPATGNIQPSVALTFYGPERVKFQQCVWPDPHGSFPWEPGYTMPAVIQPVIGTPD